MHKEVRELVDKVGAIGWHDTGLIDGSGHHVLEHDNGARFSIPASPSEYRGAKNAIACMEQIAGQKLPRPRHRRSHKADDHTDFDLHAASRDQRAWHRQWDEKVEDLTRQREQAIDRLKQLAESPSRSAIQEARGLCRQILHVENRLRDDFHQPIEPFDANEVLT